MQLNHHVIVGNLKISTLSRKEWADRMLEDVKNNVSRNNTPKIISSANGNVISKYASDVDFKRLLDCVDEIDADGMSIVFASKLFSTTPIPERVATTDFFHDAAKTAVKNNISFFLFGASEEQNNKACSKISSLYPALNIVGRRNGFFEEDEEEAIVQQIVDTKPDVLWVGLGVPKEQQFALKHKDALKGITWIKTCGGLFDFLSEKNERAPLWMQKSGLEWLYRLFQEPKRMFWRYATTNIHSIYLLCRYTKTID